MTHQMAGFISFFLCKNQIIERKDQDIYQYGFEVLLDFIVQTSLLILIGIGTQKLYCSLSFIMVFTILRRYSGGYHADTKLGCIAVTTFLCVSNIVISSFIRVEVADIIAMIAVIMIDQSDPVVQYKEEKEDTIIKRNKIKMRWISFLFLCGIFVLQRWSVKLSCSVTIGLCEG